MATVLKISRVITDIYIDRYSWNKHSNYEYYHSIFDNKGYNILDKSKKEVTPISTLSLTERQR